MGIACLALIPPEQRSATHSIVPVRLGLQLEMYFFKFLTLKDVLPRLILGHLIKFFQSQNGNPGLKAAALIRVVVVPE